MRTIKHHLIPGIFFAFLFVPVLGRTGPSLPEDLQPLLIARPNPTLAATGPLSVVILALPADPNDDSLDYEKLKAEIERKLTKAGIEVFVPQKGIMYKLPVSTDLKIQIETLKLTEAREHVFRVQTSLARAVRLAPQGKFHFKADVWNISPAMQAVSAKAMPAKITDVVTEQIETFIVEWTAANPPGQETANVGDISAPGTKQTRPPIEPPPSAGNYVASKNSTVFHKPDCSSAKRISAQNLVTYRTRQEAINAGKRPCKICKP